MDEAMIGARLRVLRRWRGMTQVQLAGLADLSPSFVSMIENGNRSLDRRSHIAAIATALRVSEADLVGGPHLSPDRQQSDPHQAIPALREALQARPSPVPRLARPGPWPNWPQPSRARSSRPGPTGTTHEPGRGCPPSWRSCNGTPRRRPASRPAAWPWRPSLRPALPPG